LTLSLGAKGRAALRKHHRVKVTVRVSFTPMHGMASSTSVTVVFH
jgi:hypothetical protein